MFDREIDRQDVKRAKLTGRVRQLEQVVADMQQTILMQSHRLSVVTALLIENGTLQEDS